jgi:transketolase
MAIAEKYLASRYNRDGFEMFDYNIYSIAGDGCLQEGISSEASSLAGHLGLGNLILIYDDNEITIDGSTSLSFTEDVAKRYEAYNWHVQSVDGDGNDMEAFEKALENAKAETSRPSIIKFSTHIGYSSPTYQGTHTVHGSPLGDDEIKLIKKNCGWDPEKSFEIPDEVSKHMKAAVENGKVIEAEYDKKFAEYEKAYPDLAKEIKDALAGKLSIDIDSLLPKFEAGSSMATRKASGDTLNALMPSMPLVLGGSADLTPSNNTWFKGAEDFQKDSTSGRYIRYGVRELAMTAVMNGIAVSGLLRPYGATFMVFCDYMRPAIRVAALSHYPSIFVLTHDSIGVGEDGPTHQPVEHLAALRAIPNLIVFRPADANETAQAWKYALENNDGPVAMCLTRQGLPVIDQDKFAGAENLYKGGYALIAEDNPDVILMATGSEVQLAVSAHEQLAADGIKAQVVSMPSFELFEKQDQAYKDSVIPPAVKARVGIEAGIEQGWGRYLGDGGIFIGMSSFGISAPAAKCFERFGITLENVVAAAKKSVGK